MPPPLHVAFAAGDAGPWRVDQITTVAGEALPGAARLRVLEGADAIAPGPSVWVLRGTTSHTRYTHRAEVDALAARQAGLGRPKATRAALIPIRKTDAWWSLAQDERRKIIEEDSRHIAIGMDYLPAVARRLHHSRELGEPFDFLTWFEYAPEHRPDFEILLRRLRASEEWHYVERETDIRLSRCAD
jgi:chlorite dismutase